MSVRLLEEVTCDRCGWVATFEKFRHSDSGDRIYRVEPLETWLVGLGWTLSDGLRKGQFCPNCSQLIRNKT